MKSTRASGIEKLLEQYGCGPISFSGTGDGLYERHLLFDSVVAPTAAGARERFEAIARSVRDVLSQRWVLTESTYEQRNPKRDLLPLDGVPHRPVAGQQRHQPAARPHRQGRRWRKSTSTGFACSRRSPTRAGQRRPRAPGGVLPRLDGDPAASGHGLRAALRIRHLQAGHPGRLAARAAGQLAPPSGPVGGRAAAGEGGGRAELLVRGAWRHPARRHWPAVHADRHPVRSPRRGLRRQDHQHAPALGRRGPGSFRLPGVQPRRVRRRAGRATRGRVPDPGALSGRLHEPGPGTALRAGVLPGRLLAGRSRAALPARQRRLERAAREGRHPAQRHAPSDGRSRADAHPARRGAPRLGRGLGPHAADARVHESHAAARGPGEVAARVVRAHAAASPGDHPRDQPSPARRRSRLAFPATRVASRA